MDGDKCQSKDRAILHFKIFRNRGGTTTIRKNAPPYGQGSTNQAISLPTRSINLRSSFLFFINSSIAPRRFPAVKPFFIPIASIHSYDSLFQLSSNEKATSFCLPRYSAALNRSCSQVSLSFSGMFSCSASRSKLGSESIIS